MDSTVRVSGEALALGEAAWPPASQLPALARRHTEHEYAVKTEDSRGCALSALPEWQMAHCVLPSAAQSSPPFCLHGCVAVKTGQVISTRVDLFPEQYTSRLASLQDSLDPMPVEVRDVCTCRAEAPKAT